VQPRREHPLQGLDGAAVTALKRPQEGVDARPAQRAARVAVTFAHRVEALRPEVAAKELAQVGPHTFGVMYQVVEHDDMNPRLAESALPAFDVVAIEATPDVAAADVLDELAGR
jgi:hypothetical protein